MLPLPAWMRHRLFFFSSRRRHTRYIGDWSSDVCLPILALLACFGLVVIYRIDDKLAREQAQWFVIGLALFVATIAFLRDYQIGRAACRERGYMTTAVKAEI